MNKNSTFSKKFTQLSKDSKDICLRKINGQTHREKLFYYCPKDSMINDIKSFMPWRLTCLVISLIC